MIRHLRSISSALLVTAVGVLSGCNDINTGQDQRTGRGNGDQLPAQGGASQGTNATATEVTTEGPGSKKIITDGKAPGLSTPYGGDGQGAAPPVTPAQGGLPSGDSNSGQLTGKEGNVGSDSTTNNASPKANLGGPGTNAPPK